jgi:D-alanyl-lipoteichoic acid acyltransferase DltB (MBOAT superfamily)
LSDALLQVLIFLGLIVLSYLMYIIVRYTRNHRPNTQLWGTIFEALSHYTQPQDQLKEPKQQIQKQKRQAGDPPRGEAKTDT